MMINVGHLDLLLEKGGRFSLFTFLEMKSPGTAAGEWMLGRCPPYCKVM